MTREIDVRAIITHIISGDGINKCRICMGDTKEGQVNLEDTVMLDGEKAATLSEVLEIVTGIEVGSDDDLPAGLCSACARSALSAANFRLFCQRAARQWTITLELFNSLPSGNKNLVTAIIDDKEVFLIDKKSISKFNCKSLINTPDDKKNITHKTLKCTECHKQFSHPFQLFYHLKGSCNSQACYICGDVMLKNELVLHVAETHDRVLFDCKMCPSLMLSENQFEEHSKNSHSVSRNNSEGCKCEFQSERQMMFSTECSMHKPEKCIMCNTVFMNHSCFLYHVQICHKQEKIETNINCAENNITVTNNKNKKTTRGNNSCICDYCGKSFAGKKFVSAHIQIVHLKNTHRPCLYCGKQLAAAHMTEHVKRHLSVQSYTCKDCGIVLKSKLGYVQHTRLHTGEKPYTCQYCGESFSASSRRSEHMRQKHNPKGVILKHTCDLCPARFRLPYRLQKHLQNVHKNTAAPNKFTCSDCREKFQTRRGLLHHNRRKHQLPNICNTDNKS